MKKHLVLVGGGHAHLTTLLNLRAVTGKGHRVTLIGPDPYHYYSGMGPGMLSGIYRPQQLRFNIKKIVEDRGASFVQDRVVKVDPNERILDLAVGGSLRYDIVSFNTGSEVPKLSTNAPDDRVVPVKPIINLFRLRGAVLARLKEGRLRLVVIGGGPAGVEVAANLWRLVRDAAGSAQITLVGGTGVLPDRPPKVRCLAVDSLSAKGIRIVDKAKVESIDSGELSLSDGSTMSYDYAVLAVGVRTSQVCRDSGLTTDEEGCLLVNDRLQSVSHPEVFGGGDVVAISGSRLAKVGVHAVRQNPILFQNLLAALDGGTMRIFNPQPRYMLILNMGDGTGILWKGSWVWSGRLPFILKDYIDKRFMRRFQVSGEPSESLNE